MDNFAVVCLKDIKGFHEIWVKPEFFEQHPKARNVKSGKALFKDFPEIFQFLHRDNGPALISTAKELNELWVLNGQILLPAVKDEANGVDDRLDSDKIEEIKRRSAFHNTVEDFLSKE